MEPQQKSLADREFDRALTALEADNAVAALAQLEKALKLWDNPAWYSYLGYCVAKERGQIRRGIDLCQTALDHERDNPVHYLNMGKIHLIACNKDEALRVLREGMTQGGNDQILALLTEFGTRKPPVIASLPRSSSLNRALGFLLSRFGIR